MRYVLLIASEESIDAARSPAEEAELMQEYGVFSQEVDAAGAMRGGERLRPTDRATTVRVRDGEALITDGPFAETKEHLGGFYIVEAANLDEAVAWAAKIPSAKFGAVEVRPIWEMGEE
ncbi:MAG: YciI family protein [Planctomycetota bacterium]